MVRCLTIKKLNYKRRSDNLGALNEAEMPYKLLSKHVWKDAVGASKKPKRLHLIADADGLFHCPVENCDSNSYQSQRGCRKHVFQRHGWYYYFDRKPNVQEVLPLESRQFNQIRKSKRSKTNDMPMFLKTCKLHRHFKTWLTSPGGGTKGVNQAEQISCRVLKYIKFVVTTYVQIGKYLNQL